MILKDKVAIVTGASSGIGKSIAEEFLKEGAAVVIADLPDSKGEGVCREFAESGYNALFTPVDVTNNHDVKHTVEQTLKKFSKIDILFNNAGIGMDLTNVEEVSETFFEKIMEINMKGIFLMTKAVIPYMKKVKSGVIINIGSTGAIRPRPGLAVYNATKGAVVAFTKSLAIELAPYGIRANCINPSATNTPMLTPVQRKEFIKNIPLGIISEPIDVAKVGLFLASDQSRMITGVDLNIDGGRCI